MNKIKLTETIQNLIKTWRYAKKKGLFVWGFVFCVLLSVISAIIPVLSAKVLLNLTNGNYRELIIFAAVVFGIEISRNVLSFFLSKVWQISFRETLIGMQYALAREMTNMEMRVLDKSSSGVFIDRLNKDTVDLAEVFNLINDYLSEFLANIGVMIAVFIVSKIMFGFFIVGMAIVFIFQRIRMKLYFIRDKKYRELKERNTGLITEMVRGMKDIKVLNAGDAFIGQTYNKLSESNQERYKMGEVERKYILITGSIKDILALSFIIFSVYLISIGNLTIASAVILYMYQSRIYNVLNVSTKLWEVIKRFNLSANRVFEIIDGEAFAKESFGKKAIKKVHGDFEFKNVSFSYEEDRSVIDNISFKIKANETVAFVGKSGSGKTTMFNLLTKLYNVNAGEILIDGINIKELTRDTIRDNISIITQSPYIFNFSIRDNLTIVKENLTEKEMIAACKLAQIHEYIMTLPDKYETIVGEGGLILSGGQRQRLAIARALIKKTEIILFDEATSSLDNETQNAIRKAINNMKSEYTILIIAHRLSTIIDSDRIIVVDNGKIIAEGKHKELLKTCKTYQRLYETELEVNNE